MKCPGCNLTVLDHILRCDCGYEFVSDSALSPDQEEVARGEKLQKIGLRLIAAGAFFALCLIIAYSSVSRQINRWEAIMQKFYKEFGTENTSVIAIKMAELLVLKDDPEKKWRVQDLLAELMTLETRDEEAWRKTKFYGVIAFCSYLTSFTAPEYIRRSGKFWPGLTAMGLLLSAGGAMYWMGKRKVGDDVSATALRLSD
ncbi:MAG: hypothetical protein ACRD2L_13040 [Terriglobia bacterium]